jgi:hypothetical protein
MNMNRDIINRALLYAGQFLLTGRDIADKNANYELCHQYYIATILEAASEVEWTGGRRRQKLVVTGRPLRRDERYRFTYDMPFDCAKPVELQNNEFFFVEDRLILTDAPGAELLYVSNGKVLRPIAVASAGRPGGVHDMEYMTAGRPGTVPEVTLWPGRPADIGEGLPGDPDPADDYPDYRAMDYEPKFYEYIEKNLAAKFAMKLSDRPELHAQLLQQAMLIKREAMAASKSRLSAKVERKKWWTEEMFG